MQIVLLQTICALVLLGILVAGLWPFHSPRNQVRWLTGSDGLFFKRHGSIVSAGAFTANPPDDNSDCSIEILLAPSRLDSSGTILAFYRPEGQVVPFALRQSLGDLVILREGQDSPQNSRKAKIYINELFRRRLPVLVTIVSSQSGTSVYADGTLVRKAPGFSFTIGDLTGKLVAGNSPTTTDNWSGQLRKLAIYKRQLSPAEISEHHENLAKGSPQRSPSENAGEVAFYPFDEGGGSVVHNRIDPPTDLVIPERFFILHAQFLENPRSEYRSDWNYWKNVGINIGGFIPLGFFFCAYLSTLRSMKQAMAATIIFGFAVSLTIEILQAFLPTRDSGMTDLITNTLGAALGAIACRWMTKRSWLTRVGISILAENS
jgi:VanZ like family/Concanavalin A-like lectin/glucanases superfamily